MNKTKLYAAMKKKHVTNTEICNKLNMSRSAFYRKCNGITEFTLSEIQNIVAILNLKSADDIFFDKKVS